MAFRADAAFAKPEIYETLERHDVDYAIRMPANKNLDLEIEGILFRPPGRPSCTPLVRYKARLAHIGMGSGFFRDQRLKEQVVV